MNTSIEPQIPAEFIGKASWKALDMPRKFGEGRSFVSGSLDDDRIRIYYFWDTENAGLSATIRFGLGAEGPIHHAHGGAVAASLDEAMGFASWVSGHAVVAATISVTFLKKVPLHAVHYIDARVEAVEDNKVSTRARLYDAETGRDYAESTGLFIKQPLDKFGELVHARALAQEMQRGHPE